MPTESHSSDRAFAGEAGRRTPGAIRQRIHRAVERARLALLWEQLWPRLAPLIWLAAGFAILSWFGLWQITPDLVRLGLVAIAGLAAIVLVVRAVRVRLPEPDEALSRVERVTGVPHRPATAVNDRLASAPDDPQARALWEAHRRRVLAGFGKLKAGLPSPGLPRRDPLALRFLVALLFVVAFLFAGGERFDRLAESVRIGEPLAEVAARVDAWATPPAYTSRPPVFLTGVNARHDEGVLSVPTGTVVTIRVSGRTDLAVSVADGSGQSDIEPTVSVSATRRSGDGDVAPREYQVVLEDAASVTVRRGSDPVTGWQFAVEPDAVPEIALAEEPSRTSSGALQLTYSLKDDYGVVDARAEFALADDDLRAEARRPLYEAPTMALSLPQLRIRDGVGETIDDLTAHPWAGGEVEVTLFATDEAQQEGKSEAVTMTLPQRLFLDPLARALVEQRRELALDANQASRVATVLDALTIAPDKTFDDFGKYLALRVAYRRTIDARDDDQLRGVVDLLWDIALGIEDGELSLSARDLRAAQEALREALERGASDEEIRRLTEELRQAMQQFLQALAQEAMRNPNLANIPPGELQSLSQQDLNRMLDRIEELARTGAQDAARQLLNQLQNMLENLQAGNPQMGSPQGQEMTRMMEELGELIRRQQELMDQTFDAQRGMQPNGQGQPMTPEQLQQMLDNLQAGQGDIQDMLQELMEQLQGMGMSPGSEFGQADRSMGEAGESLGQGQPGMALGSQGEALEALRRGAQGMMQQFGNQPGQGFGGGRGGHITEVDPLGRPLRNDGPDLGTQVKVPDEIDTQRAREILDQIRRRLADPNRPLPERDYLERLIGR